MPKIVIDIDEELYKVIQESGGVGVRAFSYHLSQIIKNGTSLPTVVQDLPMGDKTAEGLNTFEREIR